MSCFSFATELRAQSKDAAWSMFCTIIFQFADDDLLTFFKKGFMCVCLLVCMSTKHTQEPMEANRRHTIP